MIKEEKVGEKPGKAKKKSIFDLKWWFLDFAKVTGWLSFVLFFRTKRYLLPGASRRIKGRAIIICNHSSYLEPLIMVETFFLRRLRFVVSTQVAKRYPVLDWLLPRVGCIGIDKSNFSMSSITEMTDAVSGGGVLGIFPEGTLHREGGLAPFKCGVIMIALKTGAPIIPIYIKPDKNLFHRRRMVIGAPIVLADVCKSVPSVKRVNELSGMLHDSIAALKDELERMENA